MFLFNKPKVVPPPPSLDEDRLWSAAREGDVDTVRACLESRYNIADGSDKTSALQIACEGGHLDVVKLLLSNGANIHATDLKGRTPLHLACDSALCNINLVSLLLKRRANVNSKDNNGNTPLHIACLYFNTILIRLLLQHRADINEPNKKQQYPLHFVYEYGKSPHKVANVSFFILLVSSMSPSAKSRRGMKPLHLACLAGDLESAQSLLNNEADVNDVTTETPLFMDIPELEIKDTILSTLVSASKVQETPLSIACALGDLNMAELLLSRGANINVILDTYGSLLHLAILRNSTSVAQWLISKNIDITITDKEGNTAIGLIKSENIDILSYSVSKHFCNHTDLVDTKNRLDEQQNRINYLERKLNELTEMYSEESKYTTNKLANQQISNKNVESQLKDLSERCKVQYLLFSQQSTKLEHQLAKLSAPVSDTMSSILGHSEQQNDVELQLKGLSERISEIEELRIEQKSISEKQSLSAEVTAYWASSTIQLYEHLEEWHKSIVKLLDHQHGKNWALECQSTARRLYREGDIVGSKAYFQVALSSEGIDEALRVELMTEIAEIEKISDEGMKSFLERDINTLEVEIQEAAEHFGKAISEEERKSIDEQRLKLTQQHDALLRRLEELALRQSTFDKQLEAHKLEREKWEEVIKLQQSHIDMLELMANSNSQDNSNEGLRHQMSLVMSANNEVQAVKLRLERQLQNVKKTWTEALQKEKILEERLELLQKQMEIFTTKGLSPDKRAFRDYLKSVKRTCRIRSKLENTPFPLECFISYAWNPDPVANKTLQSRLARLKEDLEMVGLKVTLDIRNMRYNTKEFMVGGITKAHKMLLICTPRLKERAAESTPNNLHLELQTALNKSQQHPELITPLIFEGTFDTSIPPQVKDLLALTFVETDTPDKGYYEAMTSLAPLGLIPSLLSLEADKDYKHTYNHLINELSTYYSISQ